MPIRQVGEGDSLQDWFKSLPLVTKILLVSTLLSGVAITFNFIPGELLILDWGRIRYEFHFWRLFTCFVIAGPFSFNFAMHTYILYENCKRYEANPFNTGAGGSSADFIWMLLTSMTLLLFIGPYFNMYVLSEPILYVIIHVWSRREPDIQLSMFGFKFKSVYLPLVYVIIRLIMGGSITEPLTGIAVGHLYYFLASVVPLSHGYQLVRTPKFCIDLATYCSGFSPIPVAQGFQATPPPAARNNNTTTTNNNDANNNGNLRYRRPVQTGTYQWGQGRTLGSQ